MARLPDISTCPRCRAPLPTGSDGDLCPACLLSGALDPAATLSLAFADTEAPADVEDCPRDLGPYRLLGLLGRGGMGAVYEAEDRRNGRRVALKMLGRQLDTADLRGRFLREGRLAAGINHPHSLYVFGSEEIDDRPVITMEIAAGGTLHDRLAREGPLPPRRAVDAMLDVIAGLEAAEARGVLHRDIKPSNCFVGPDGSVKIGDFGLSVSTLAPRDTFVTACGKVLGTPAFAAPEQLRGDRVDRRADIYAVGATLFTLLTRRPPFAGDNAVQVVAQVLNERPPALTALCPDAPPGLQRVIQRCLAKDPGARYPDYPSLRRALLPCSSREPEPASLRVRVAAGWVDYLLAFLPVYVALMITVGPEDLLLRPIVERSLYAARYYLTLFGVGLLYFTLAEGLWGAGLGKALKGLVVVDRHGRPPGPLRALLRILVPLACVEGLRLPWMMAVVHDLELGTGQVLLFVLAANVCAWVPVLLTVGARSGNGYRTVWDYLTGTRVVHRPPSAARPAADAVEPAPPGRGHVATLGPFQVSGDLVPGRWRLGLDPVLRRRLWFLRREVDDPARRRLARPGRPRWLQTVSDGDILWDVFEAPDGRALTEILQSGTPLLWARLRFWLHDLATELWEAEQDGTGPATLCLGQVWITTADRALLLDAPWPGTDPGERHDVRDLPGQQRFLQVLADRADNDTLPLHARAVLANLAAGRFAKLSFLAGTLRGLLERPVTVHRALRAGSLFMLPAYIWITVFVGYYQGERVAQWQASLGRLSLGLALGILGVIALVQLLGLPFGSTGSHAIFRLAVVDRHGRRARPRDLLRRWLLVWPPLLLPQGLTALTLRQSPGTAFLLSAALFVLWLGAAVHAALSPRGGLHERLTRTRIVRC